MNENRCRVDIVMIRLSELATNNTSGLHPSFIGLSRVDCLINMFLSGDRAETLVPAAEPDTNLGQAQCGSDEASDDIFVLSGILLSHECPSKPHVGAVGVGSRIGVRRVRLGETDARQWRRLVTVLNERRLPLPCPKQRQRLQIA